MSNGFKKGYVPKDLILVEKLEDLIEEHFMEHKTAGFYCGLLNTTERIMNSHMKFHRNRSVAEAIRLRVNQWAMEFLKKSNEPIKQAAYELGFNAPGDFTKSFKLLNGTTPRKFRQLHRKNTAQ